MANRYPIIVDTTDGNKLKEIPSGDNLQLTGNGIIGVTDVTASGTVAAGVLSATSIKKGGTELATVAVTGSYNDLINRPTQFSDLIDDLNVLVPGDNVGQLFNNVGYLTSVAFSDLTTTPNTLGGYGIIDAATSLQGSLATTAVQPGANISTFFNDQGYVTAADLSNGLITVDVNNTGDLVGSVFADDSTLMIDSILAAFNLDGTIRTNVVPAANGVYDLGTDANKFKDLHISGNILGGITGNLTQTLVQSFLSNSQSLQLTKASARIISFAPVGTSATVLLPEEDYEGIIFTLISLASNANSFTVSGALSSFTVAPGEVKSFVFDGSDWALASTSTGGAGGGSIGNFTFASSVVDTDDSSGIVITPAVTMSSDLTVENDLTVNGDIITTSTGTPEIFSDGKIHLTAATRVSVLTSPFKLANFTSTERDALTAENGDTIYNTTTNKFQGYANGAWVDLH
jgi:hypothetical protein